MVLYRATHAGKVEMTAEEEAETRSEWAASMVDQAASEVKRAALEKLKSLDDKSIRAIREWIVGQPGSSSEALAIIENEAILERSKLKS